MPVDALPAIASPIPQPSAELNHPQSANSNTGDQGFSKVLRQPSEKPDLARGSDSPACCGNDRLRLAKPAKESSETNTPPTSNDTSVSDDTSGSTSDNQPSDTQDLKSTDVAPQPEKPGTTDEVLTVDEIALAASLVTAPPIVQPLPELPNANPEASTAVTNAEVVTALTDVSPAQAVAGISNNSVVEQAPPVAAVGPVVDPTADQPVEAPVVTPVEPVVATNVADNAPPIALKEAKVQPEPKVAVDLSQTETVVSEAVPSQTAEVTPPADNKPISSSTASSKAADSTKAAADAKVMEPDATPRPVIRPVVDQQTSDGQDQSGTEKQTASTQNGREVAQDIPLDATAESGDSKDSDKPVATDPSVIQSPNTVDNQTSASATSAISSAPAINHRLPPHIATAEPTANARPVVPHVDANRFLQRVARAFQAAEERGSEVRLRLSPPELGSMQLEVSVREGVLAARVETETSSARQILLDNLPQLRERLAEQGMKIEKFDVDVSGQHAGNMPDAQQQAREEERRRNPTNNSGRTVTEDQTPRGPRLPANNQGLNVLI